jgi:NAD-dependent deacetylase
VWFGEDLPQTALAEAVAASEGCDVALVVGTSGLVEPAASLPGIALAAGVYVAEINPEPTPLSASVHHRERGPAGTILPRLLRRVFG